MKNPKTKRKTFLVEISDIFKALNRPAQVWLIVSLLWILFFTYVFSDSFFEKSKVYFSSFEHKLSSETKNIITYNFEPTYVLVSIPELEDKIYVKIESQAQRDDHMHLLRVLAPVFGEFRPLVESEARKIWWIKFLKFMAVALSFPIISFLFFRRKFTYKTAIKVPRM